MAQGRPPRGTKRRKGKPDREKDLALVFGPSADGEGFNVLRRRAGAQTVEAGTVHPLREGRAITGEVVRMAQREEAPFLFDCETDEELSAPRPAQPPSMTGPPQVASEEYRRGWDAIWGSRTRRTPPSAVN
jgi:hypothetical protein